MKKAIFLALALLLSVAGAAQHQLIIRIAGSDSGEPLAGANIYLPVFQRGGAADADGGVTLADLPAGPVQLRISYLGYRSQTQTVVLPHPDTLFIDLEPAGEEMEAITVTTTRSSRLIEDLPTRIEVITEEELVEKAVMNSANIAMLLRESTGILMQQTSALSANQSIRIQGLPGRYTQLLKNGFPLFGGFAGGLSILQIPPLDLYQVEVIKGSASTLYGGGAIAGLVNLISREPEEETELSLMVNQTSAGGSTLNAFFGERAGITAATVFTSGNLQSPYDPNDDGFSDLPRVRGLTLNPTFFLYPDQHTRIRLSVTGTWENRLGGDMVVIRDRPQSDRQFTEENISTRYVTQLEGQRTFASGARLTLRNSISFFDRAIAVPDYRFRGREWSSFSELNLSFGREERQWIAGANLWTDDFREEPYGRPLTRDFRNATTGVFLQNTWTFSPHIALESGLRGDYHTDFGFFALPRLSLLIDPNPHWTIRLGGGLGYQAPTIFTEEAERAVFRNFLPIDRNTVDAERSAGANLDVNYRGVLLNEVSLALNTLLFYTRLNRPLILETTTGGDLRYRNATGFVDSRGAETNLRLSWRDFRLFFNYALIDARLRENGRTGPFPLTPKHNAGLTLMYENETWRIGYELYYTGQQYLSNGEPRRDYWIMGLMGLRNFGAFSLFLNFENFIDTRQSRFEGLWFPPRQTPTFREIWAPTDGFIVNGGIKVNLIGGE